MPCLDTEHDQSRLAVPGVEIQPAADALVATLLVAGRDPGYDQAERPRLELARVFGSRDPGIVAAHATMKGAGGCRRTTRRHSPSVTRNWPIPLLAPNVRGITPLWSERCSTGGSPARRCRRRPATRHAVPNARLGYTALPAASRGWIGQRSRGHPRREMKPRGIAEYNPLPGPSGHFPGLWRLARSEVGAGLPGIECAITPGASPAASTFRGRRPPRIEFSPKPGTRRSIVERRTQGRHNGLRRGE